MAVVFRLAAWTASILCPSTSHSEALSSSSESNPIKAPAKKSIAIVSRCFDFTKKIKILPTAPLLAVYIFFREPSGCFAWYIQKYLRCPLSDNTVPIQFFGFILMSLGSGKVRLRIFLYHCKPKNWKKYMYICKLYHGKLRLCEMRFFKNVGRTTNVKLAFFNVEKSKH